MSSTDKPIPYKIACLVYVFNDAGQLLLLHRSRPPNLGMYSPIGGKLEQQLGESPHECALRETHEEIGVSLSLSEIHLLGIVSERAFVGQSAAGTGAAGSPAHWLMFCFESTRRINFPARDIPEGRLEWIDPAAVATLQIPKTDREVIWPLIEQHSRNLPLSASKSSRDAIFSVHIDCTDEENFVVTYLISPVTQK